MDLIVNSNVQQKAAAELTESALMVIRMLTAGGWLDQEILEYHQQPQPLCDRAYKQEQIMT